MNAKKKQNDNTNESSQSVRACLWQCFEEIGGQEAFTEWAKDNPSEFYALCGTMRPVDVVESIKAELNIQTEQ